MDLTSRLTELEEMVRDAKSMPLSSSALLNRDEVLDLIEDLKSSLPDEIKQARWVVKDREELLAKARRDAEAMVEQARAEQLRLASHEAVMQRAKDEAERIVQEADEDARRLRLEAEDYVDAKLAQLEGTLQKILEEMIGVQRRALPDDRPGRRGAREAARRHAERRARARADPVGGHGGRGGVMRAIDVRDLLETPGSSRTVRVEEPVPGLRTELADVPEDTPIAAELTLESVVEGIYVRGSLEGRFTMRCARCLKTFERDFDVEMTELVARDPGPDDDYALAPDLTLDPEPIVRDAVVLEMPFSPLCRPDCLGLCEICGGDRNLGECPGHEVTDPRWDALDVLLQGLDVAADPDEGTSDRDDRSTTS